MRHRPCPVPGEPPLGGMIGFMMSGDLELHTMGEIIAYFSAGTHRDELDGSHLYQWPDQDDSEAVTVGTTFYVLPPPMIDDETNEPAWASSDPGVAALAERLGLRFGYLGEYLSDTLQLVRDCVPDASPERIAEAFDYYLKRDTWPDWLE